MALSFKSAPRISQQQFVKVLEKGTVDFGASPAASCAAELYQIIAGYGLDPAVALAFFGHESQYGNDGICKKFDTKSLGNVRDPFDRSRMLEQVTTHNGPFARYRSWQDGARDWCERILHNYIEKRGLPTVEAAIPVYAPSSDNNNVQRYIDHVNELVARWQREDPAPPTAAAAPAASTPVSAPVGQPVASTPSAVSLSELQQALFAETFRAAGAEFHADWSFHQFALREAKAGRFLGSPLGESRRMTHDGQQYSVQVFARDTLYTPIASPESSTNWNDVRKLSDLMRG